MRRDLCSYLEDIIRAADDISFCVGGLGFETFASVDTIFSTVAFKFIIIGEALRQIELQFPEVLASIPDAREIVGQRNRIVHGYFDIDEAVLWDALKDDLPLLIEEVVRLRDLHCNNDPRQASSSAQS
jgi:uncharacterized protein with HEPN domain